jgi:hypothetical protein
MNTVVKQTGRLVEANTYDEDGSTIVEINIRLPKPNDPKAFLAHFYVVPRLEKMKGREKYKGVGKKALCKVIGGLVEEKKLTPETMIELDASGGTVPEGFTTTESEESLDKFLASYPSALADLNHDVKLEKREITIQDKARLAEAIRQNHRLIAYYKTYGLTVVEDKGESARMTGTIGRILSACQTGGARRKTHRTKRMRKFSRRK